MLFNLALYGSIGLILLLFVGILYTFGGYLK